MIEDRTTRRNLRSDPPWPSGRLRLRSCTHSTRSGAVRSGRAPTAQTGSDHLLRRRSTRDARTRNGWTIRFWHLDAAISTGWAKLLGRSPPCVSSANPAVEPFFILGADSLVDLPNWRAPDEIAQFGEDRGCRETRALPSISTTLEHGDTCIAWTRYICRRYRSWTVSSRDIRERVREEKPIWYLLPPARRGVHRRAGSVPVIRTTGSIRAR